MRVMVLIKANAKSEAGVMPGEKLISEMQTFNERLVEAGVMLAGEGLQPSSKGKRIKLSGARKTVTDGPFAETKELLAGFWIWKVKSMDEAVDWARRIPNPDDEPAEVELRPVGETEDFDMSPELKDREKALYARLAKEAGRR
jgi:hypothetical protein